MRVLILEDEPSMAALLEQLVKHLWPGADVQLAADALTSLEQWKSGGADLALLDLELPGMSGIEVLKQIKRSAPTTVCVMVSAHADRPSILAAGLNHVDAFIVKPFDIDEVKKRLSQIMAAQGAEPQAAPLASPKRFDSIHDFVADRLARGFLGLPIAPALVTDVKRIRHLGAEEMRALLQRCQQEPAIVLRVLSLANSHSYLRGPEPIETFGGALRRIGLDGLFNLTVELSLLRGSLLEHDWLRARYLELQRGGLALADIVTRLGEEVEFDIEASRAVCVLYRIGELALLQLMQIWLDSGHPIDPSDCTAILARHGAWAADEIMRQWPLPTATRARMLATHAQPSGTVRKDQLVMRIASLIQAGDPGRELPRLLTRLGLPADILARGDAFRRTPIT